MFPEPATTAAMSRKLFQRLAPSQAQLREMRSLRFLGHWIYEPNLWHINRQSTAMAFAIGLFCAMVPAPGQVFVAAFMAVRLRANLPLSVSLIFVTNPLTMPVIYYAAYELGATLLDRSMQSIEFEISWSWLSQRLGDIWQPFLLGCFVIGACASVISYFVINLLWRWRVVSAWQERAKRRRNKQG